MAQEKKTPNKNGSQTMVADSVNPNENKPVETQPAEETKTVEPVGTMEVESRPMTAMEQVMAQHKARQEAENNS